MNKTITTMLINDSQNQRYKFKTPMLVYIEETTTGYVVSDELTYTYGVGDTLCNAIEDYLYSYMVFFEYLEKHEETLTANLPHILYFMRYKFGLINEAFL